MSATSARSECYILQTLDKVIIRLKELPKVYVFECDCGHSEERTFLNEDEAKASYEENPNCTECT